MLLSISENPDYSSDEEGSLQSPGTEGRYVMRHNTYNLNILKVSCSQNLKKY